MSDLKGKVAVVTGAGRKSGIGAAIAYHLAQKGADLVIGDICQSPSDLPHTGSGAWDELVSIAENIKTSGVDCLPVKVDITIAESVQEMVSQVEDRFGRLDILVNNAGTAIGPAPVLHMAEEAWRKTIEINATGAFLCAKFALPLMIKGESGGRIINMASIAAIKPRPFMSAYAGSKAAVVALTQSLAQEVAEFGITVNAILPGDIDTEMKQWGLHMESLVTGQTKEDVTASLAAKIPLGRLGVPNDVAQLVTFLASDEANFLTGQAFNVTGGRELV